MEGHKVILRKVYLSTLLKVTDSPNKPVLANQHIFHINDDFNYECEAHKLILFGQNLDVMELFLSEKDSFDIVYAADIIPWGIEEAEKRLNVRLKGYSYFSCINSNWNWLRGKSMVLVEDLKH